MSEDLIRRLQERIRLVPTVDNNNIKLPIHPRPPVSEQAMMNAEARLSFALPPLVRALYTQVADGGYGPGYGVIQLAGNPYTLVESRVRMEMETAPQWMWPEGLVELVHWGCHYFSGIDCLHPSCPVFFYDHDLAVGDAKLSDCLFPEAASLVEWFSAWLDGANLWELGKQRRGANRHA
jgi:hypothetical protein